MFLGIHNWTHGYVTALQAVNSVKHLWIYYQQLLTFDWSVKIRTKELDILIATPAHTCTHTETPTDPRY